jgi:hypothetical protein
MPRVLTVSASNNSRHPEALTVVDGAVAFAMRHAEQQVLRREELASRYRPMW